jgi:hypothetical protein
VPETHWHVRSAITGARVIVDVTEEQAHGECERLNREAATGERAAYGDGDQHVPAQRLVAENTGQALADDPDDQFRPDWVGRILHAGQPMVYEVEREERMTVEEIEEERKRLEAERTRS